MQAKGIRLYEVRVWGTGERMGYSRHVGRRLLPYRAALAVARRLRRWGREAFVAPLGYATTAAERAYFAARYGVRA